MSKEKSTTTTRREFLGAATVTAAALASTTIGQAKEISNHQGEAPELQVAQASTETSSSVAGDTPLEGDWSKPKAIAIPKGGYFGKPEQGRYGPIFPKTPACYGFSIIAKLIPGREEACYKHAKTIEGAIAKDPNYLAVLKLHYLRWQLFKINGETYFQYQGIFDTDFDKYTEDAVALFSAGGIDTVFENLEGFPKDWKTRPAGFIEFVRDHHCPSFLEYGEYPYVSAAEIKKALRVRPLYPACLIKCSSGRSADSEDYA